MLLIDTCAKYFINIIDIIPPISRIAVQHRFHICFCEYRCILLHVRNTSVSQLIHHISHIIIICKLGTIHKLRKVCIHRCSYWTVICDSWLSFLSSLCCNNDNTTCALQTVHSRRSSIFQDRYTLNIIRINVIDGTRHTIYNISNIVNRTTNPQYCLVITRFSRDLNRRNARQTSA